MGCSLLVLGKKFQKLSSWGKIVILKVQASTGAAGGSAG